MNTDSKDSGNKAEAPEEKTREQKLNSMRREFRKTETLWLVCCCVSLIATFVYLFFIYKKQLFADSPLKYIFIVVLLVFVFFCIYWSCCSCCSCACRF